MDYSKANIIDPYCGTGTTLKVAKHFEFNFIVGIEIDSKWNEVIQEKINEPFDYEEPLPEVKNSYKDNKGGSDE